MSIDLNNTVSIRDADILGAEKLTDGAFVSSADWTLVGDCAITGGQLVFTEVVGTGQATQVVGDMVSSMRTGKWYLFEYDVVSITGTINFFVLDLASGTDYNLPKVTGNNQRLIFKYDGTDFGQFSMTITGNPGSAMTLDNFSLKEITGGDLDVAGDLDVVGEILIPHLQGTYKNVTVLNSGDSPYDALLTDDILLCGTGSGSITVNLPDIYTTGIEKVYTFKKTHASNSLIIDPEGSQNIDGSSTLTLTEDDEAVVVVGSSQAAWETIGRNVLPGTIRLTGRVSIGDGYIDASTARSSETSIVAISRIIVTPTGSDNDYFALGGKVDGQMIVIHNSGGSVGALIDQDATTGITVIAGQTIVAVWDSSLSSWLPTN